MDINGLLSIASTLNIFSCGVGLLVGALLLYFSRKKNISKWLGLFLLTLGLSYFKNSIEEFGLISRNPRLFYLPFHFYFLSFPLLYLFVRSFTTKINLKEDKIHLYPGMIEFLLWISLFVFIPNVLTHPFKKSVEYAIYFEVYVLIGNFYSIWYIIKTIGLLPSRNIKNTLLNHTDHGNFFGHLENLLYGFLVLIISHLTFTVAMIFSNSDNFIQRPYILVIYVLLTVLNTVWIHLLAALGIRKSLLNISRERDDFKISDLADVMIGEEDHEIFEKINHILNETKCFKMEDFTVGDLAKLINIHPQKVSRIIKNRTNENFNTFINIQRVQEIKNIILSSDRAQDFSVEGLGQEVGFKSRSTLYAAFKKIEGCTPGDYIRNN